MLNAFFNKILRFTVSREANTNVSINGRTYTGGDICIQNNKVFIDGKEQPENLDKTVINITIHGDCGYVDGVINSITITGDVHGKVSTVSGDINCKDVYKDVSTVSGDVHCQLIKGNVETLSGNITSKT